VLLFLVFNNLRLNNLNYLKGVGSVFGRGKMDYSLVDKEIQKINKKLRAGYGQGTIRRVTGSLYLRATFPPKPGETKAKSRELPLKMKATVRGLRAALEKSIAITTDLALDRFDWADYLPTPIEEAVRTFQPCTVGEFAALARAEYFDKREETPDTLINWMADYGYPYRLLPESAPLSIELLKKHILNTQAGTKSRTRSVMAYSKLAMLAELDHKPLLALKSNYRSGEVLQRDLPDLATVVEWHQRLPESVQFEYAIRAAFGLRPGEGAQFCDFANLRTEKELSVYSSKLGEWRVTYPYPIELFDTFNLGTREPVIFKSRGASVKTQTASFRTKLTRLGLPFNLYDLRHLYAWHTIVAGLDVRLAAKFMGHSVEVHTSTYNRFLTKEHFRQLRNSQAQALDQTE
jgi:integrase